MGQLKVKNAKRVDNFGKEIINLKEWKLSNPDAIHFDSVFEWWVAATLTSNGIKFMLKPPKLVLVPKFTTTDFDYSKEVKSVLTNSKRKASDTKEKSSVSRAFNKANQKVITEISVLPETWSVDFYLYDYNIYLEAKGFANDGFANKLKLARYLSQNQFKIIVVYSKKDVIDLLHFLTQPQICQQF